jgi:hypothetical protein
VTPAEWRAAGRLAGRAVGGLVSWVEQVHQAVAGRVFGGLRQVGAPARLVHDGLASGIYLAVRDAGTAAGVVSGEVLGLLGAGGEPAGARPGGNLALAALNAVVGDELESGLDALAIGMAVRAGGRDVSLRAGELAALCPDATPGLAVFVHGLAETEDSWQRRAEDRPSVCFGQRLRAEFGYTPVYVRYNTGRHVSANGRDLATLLAGLIAAWPKPVTELLLVGHSMGGLVIRSACHYAGQGSGTWEQQVRHVFYLGSPHLGAPLARAAGFAGWALGIAPETRPFVTLVNGRSAGIKDLRYGYLLDDDWAGCDQDSCVHDHRHDVPLPAGVNHHVISATVTANPNNLFGALVGDLLVQPASAHGRSGRHQHIRLPARAGHRLGGMHHFDLLSHPAVWQAMRGLLAAPSTFAEPT